MLSGAFQKVCLSHVSLIPKNLDLQTGQLYHRKMSIPIFSILRSFLLDRNTVLTSPLHFVY